MRRMAYVALLSAAELLIGCGPRATSMVHKAAPAHPAAINVSTARPTPAFVQPLTETPAMPMDASTDDSE